MRSRSKYQQEALSLELTQFVQRLSRAEQVALTGIDIMQKNDRFFCLECNPNPGWAGFHRFSNDEKDLAQSILKVLQGKKDECPAL